MCSLYSRWSETRGAFHSSKIPVWLISENWSFKCNEIFRNFWERSPIFGKIFPDNSVAFNFPPEIFGSIVHTSETRNNFQIFQKISAEIFVHLSLFRTVLNFWLNAGSRIPIFCQCSRAGLFERRLTITQDQKLTGVPIFLPWKCFPLLMFCVVWYSSSSKLKTKQHKQKTLLKSYKTEITILANSVLAIVFWTTRPWFPSSHAV